MLDLTIPDIIHSFAAHQVKYSELTLDTFRMLQSLEWEPSGSFYQANTAPSSGAGSGASQNGASGPSRVNQDMTDPTLPPNPRKAILFRPSVTHFMAVSIHPQEVLLSRPFLYHHKTASLEFYIKKVNWKVSHSYILLDIND